MGSFIAELQRHSVFKAGVTCAVIAWLLIQIIVSVDVRLQMPDWTDTLAITILLNEFPVVLILVRAFDLTQR